MKSILASHNFKRLTSEDIHRLSSAQSANSLVSIVMVSDEHGIDYVDSIPYEDGVILPGTGQDKRQALVFDLTRDADVINEIIDALKSAVGTEAQFIGTARAEAGPCGVETQFIEMFEDSVRQNHDLPFCSEYLGAA